MEDAKNNQIFVADIILNKGRGMVCVVMSVSESYVLAKPLVGGNESGSRIMIGFIALRNNWVKVKNGL